MIEELRVGVVFNVLCSSRAKEDRLIESARRLDSAYNLEFSVRIRGSHAKTARDRISDVFVGKKITHHLLGEAPNASWTEATALQVESLETPLILMCQEDHWLVNSKALDQMIESCTSASVDYCRTSFYPQSQQTLGRIQSQSEAEFISSGNCVHMKFENPGQTLGLRQEFAVGLVGLFSRDYLRKLLAARLRFPLFYGHETPFVFERKFGDTAVYPVRLGFPQEEVFACVDDDFGIPGYSLASRGLAEGTRNISHRGPILDKVTLVAAGVFGKFKASTARRLQLWLGMPIWFRNYLLYLFALLKDNRK